MTGTARLSILVGLWIMLALPLVVALVSLTDPTWFPVLDLAMTELRVRDVGGPHTPLIGLPGRIGDFPEQGSHPGPLSFYALAPIYRLLGSTAWALQAATVALNALALAAAIAIAHRRGGLLLAGAVGAVLALLTRGYGIETLVEPWNPYLPLLWWVVTLLAVWSVLDGDTPMLVVAAAAGSLAAQTHVPYLGLVLGLGAVATVAVLMRAARAPRDRARALKWLAVAAAVTAVLWAPVLLDQMVRTPGNLSMLRDHFLDPPEEPVGMVTGARLTLLHLDVLSFLEGSRGATGSLVSASSDPSGSLVPGIVALILWSASVAVAWRERHRALLMLHAVTACGLVLVTYSLSRIFGKLWYYLMLSAWAVTATLMLSIAWGAVLLARELLPSRQRAAGRAALAVLISATAVSSILFATTAQHVAPPAPRLSVTLGNVIPETAAALAAGAGPATGRDGRYLVTWEDAFYIGSQGYGVVNELERRGFEAGVLEPWRVPVTRHRVLDPAHADARVHFATGPFIDEWRSRAEAIEVAHHDPRTPAQRDEYDRLRRQVSRSLRGAGLGDLVPVVERNLFGATLDPRVPDDLREQMERMLHLGLPGAVFLTESDAP